LLVGALSEPAGEALIFTTAKGLRIRTEGGAGATHLIIRPEHVRIGPDAERAANRYTAEVLEALYVGDLVKYRVVAETGDELWAKTLAPATGQRWSNGQRVTVGWEPGDSLTVSA